MTKRYVLYHIYDSDNELLYVGATTNPGGRLNGHARHQPWWDDAATIKVEHFDSLEELLSEEAAAIQVEGPRYNQVLSKPAVWAMKPRRPRGAGSVFQRADGCWIGAIELSCDQNGKRRRKQVYGRDRETVLRKLEDLKQSLP